MRKYHKSDPNFLKLWLKKCFSYFENIDVYSKLCFPNIIQGGIPDFHREIYEILNSDSNDAFAAPRGFAKSTITGLIYLSWLINNDKEDFIVYISSDFEKSTQFIEPLQQEYIDNEMLKYVYGDMTPKAVHDKTGKFRRDCIDINKIRIQSVSFDKNVRGFRYGTKRPSLIILDDIDLDTRVRNPRLRDDDIVKINKIILPALRKGGRWKWIGTILGAKSPLKQRIDMQDGKIYDGEDDGNGNLLWGEYWDREALDKLKDPEQGMGIIAYNQEIRNKPTASGSKVITDEMIEASLDRNLTLQKVRPLHNCKRVVQGQDFAFGTSKNADDSFFLDVMERRDGKHVILDFWADNGFNDDLGLPKNNWKNEQLAVMTQRHAKYKHEMVIGEKNSILAITTDIKQLGFPFTMVTTGGTDSIDKSKKKMTISKHNAIERLETRMQVECNKIVIPYGDEETRKKMDQLIEELQSWARDEDGNFVELGVHPNGPISLIMACEYLDNFQKRAFSGAGF